MFFSGAAFRFSFDVSKRAMSVVKKFLSNYVKENSHQLGDEKTLKFLLLAIRGIQMRIKMSPEQTYKILKEQVYGKDIFAADAIDLIDEIGLFLSESRFIDYYDNIPFIQEFINSVHAYAWSDIEIGISSPKFTISSSIQTSGIKNLFDLVIQGMQED